MRKSTHPSLHFRYQGVSDQTLPVCCGVVDVCVNRELLNDVQDSRDYESDGNGLLVRLHWDTVEQTNTYSTLIVDDTYRQAATALATNHLALQEFVTDMYEMYNLKVVAVCSPPLTLLIQHERDLLVQTLSSDRNIAGLLKGLLSQCAPSERPVDVNYRIEQGIKIELPPLSTCGCLARGKVMVSRGVQTECDATYTNNAARQQETLNNNNTRLAVEKKFTSITAELSAQRHYVQSELKEQRKENDEMKMMLQEIASGMVGRNTNRMSQKHHRSAENGSLGSNPMNSSVAESHSRRGSGKKTSISGQKEEREDKRGHTGTPNGEGKTKREEVVGEQKTNKSSKEVDEKMEVDSSNPRRGPVIKEFVGDELRSLPTARATPAMRYDSHSRKTQAFPYATQKYQYNNYRSSNAHQYPGQGESDTRDTLDQSPYDTQYFQEGDYYGCAHANQGAYSRSNYTTKNQYGSKGYGQTNALNYPNSQRQMYESRYGGEYADLQHTNLNFMVEMQNTIRATKGAKPTKLRCSDESGSTDRLRLLFEAMIGENPEKEELWKRVEEALADTQTNRDDPSQPYVETALDTVVLLDTSGSVKDEDFHSMKESVLNFITGVEDIAEQHELEENIAVVTFGGRGQILHPLSNDYGCLRDVIEGIEPSGPSPLLEGLLVSIACLSKGGELDFSGVLKLAPRIIIFTDGLATGIDPQTADDRLNTDELQATILVEAFKHVKKRQPEDHLQGLVSIVPVGQANRGFLLSLAHACGGSLVDASDSRKLCKIQKIYSKAGEALPSLVTKKSGPVASGMQPLSFYVDSSLMLENEELQVLKNNIQNIYVDYYTITDFNNILELPDLPPLGSRVMRGPDWMWENQDTEGAGTVFNHGLDGQYLWVLWDNSTYNVYRYGQNGCFEVQPVDGQPREADVASQICTGLVVERGPDWHVTYGDQDGGKGSLGVIIREQQDLRRVKVRWENGAMFEYRYGEDNMFDVSTVDSTKSSSDAK